MAFKLQSLPNNVDAYNGFVNNTPIAYDVTWDSSEWNYTGSGWNGARLMLVYNEQGSGWDPPIGISPDANGFRQPDLDRGNPSNQGFWDLTNYPVIHTRTMLWDYSHLLPALTSTATGGYTEFILESNFGSFNWPASVYIDNVRFTTPTVVQLLLGDFNLSGVVDAAGYTVWRDNFNAANDSALNGNGDNVAGVGPGDYTIWKSNFGKHGSGAGANGFVGSSVVPEPAGWLLGLCAFGWISQARRRS